MPHHLGLTSLSGFSEMNKKKSKLIEAYSAHISLMSDLLCMKRSTSTDGSDKPEISEELVSLELLQKSWREALLITDTTDKTVRTAIFSIWSYSFTPISIPKSIPTTEII